MASDQATVHLILGLLDRHSFKTLEHTVQQFKDHKQRFHESLLVLKCLKPSAGILSDAFSHPSPRGVQAKCTPMKPPTGGDSLSISTQVRCTPSKPPVNSTFVQEAIENHGSKPYSLRPHVSRKRSVSGAPQRITRSRAKQHATSTAAACNNSSKMEFVVLEDDFVEVGAKVNRKPGQNQQASFQDECPTEAAVSGYGKAYQNQSLEQLGLSSQDVIVATTTAQNVPEICKRELLTPSSIKSFKNAGKETCRSQDVISTQKQPEMCKGELLTPSLKSSNHLCKETLSSSDPVLGLNATKQFHVLSPHIVQQIPLSHKGNSVTPCQNTVNYNREHLHKQHEEDGSFSRNHSIDTGAVDFAKSPSACIRLPTSVEQSFKQIIDGVQCKASQEKQIPTDADDGPCIICPKKDDALALPPSSITLRHSPPSTRQEFNGTDTRQSNSRKRKLSVFGGPASCIVANDDVNRRKRISSSINSIEVEAFKFDMDDLSYGKEVSEHFKFAARLCKVNMRSLCVQDDCDQARRPAFKGLSTPGIKDSAKIKESSIGTVETGRDWHADSVASEKPSGILSLAHYEAVGSGAHACDNNFQGVLKDIQEGKPALPDSLQVTTQKVHQACETIEPPFDNSRDTHIEECNNESRSEVFEKQDGLVSECACADQLLLSNLNSPAVGFSVQVQPEQEMGSLRSKGGLLLTTSAQVEACLHEIAEAKVTLCSGTPIHLKKALASRNTAVGNDDLSSQEKAIGKVKFSPTWEKCKESDVFITPNLKLIVQNILTLSPGMRRSSALNNVDQMQSSLLLSASKSILKRYSVIGVAELASDDAMPNLKANEEFTSVPMSPCGSMSSAVQEPVAVDNVLVGPAVDTHSLHTEAGNTLYDMEDKFLVSVETKVGLSTQLGDTFQWRQVGSECDFAFKESIKTPGQLTSATEAGIDVKLEEIVGITEERNSLMLSPAKNLDNCESVRESSSLANEDVLPAMGSEDPNMESSSKPILTRPESTVHIQSPILLQHEEEMAAKVVGVMPQMKETESCCLGIKLGMPCSQDTECQPSWRSEELHQYDKSTMKCASLGVPSPSALKDELRIESSTDMEMKKRTAEKSDDGDAISNSTGSQMDCSESPSPSFKSKENKAGEDKSDQLHRENKSTQEWKLTPEGDEDILRFNQLLAQGTVNSNRRKRARSPVNSSDESYKDHKKMKLSVIENDGQISDEKLAHAFVPQSSSFPPLFSPIRRFQDTFGITFQDNFGNSPSSNGFDSLQRQVEGSNKLCKSYSRLSGLRRECIDTPHMTSARAGLVNRTGSRFKNSEWHLDTHLEDGKENQTPEPWSKDKGYRSTGLLSEKQATADTRKVLGCSNQSLGGLVESTHKCYNLAVETRSFLDLVQQKQLPLPYPNGKREVRVKALEAADLARRQEERRENERKIRRLECNEAKGIDLEGCKDKMMPNCASTMAVKGITEKVKRVAELKMKMDQDKAKKQEVEHKKKEEERKKKEAEFADKKRKREDADRKDREEKRKRVEGVQRLKKEQEERQRSELEEKEHKRKMLEERERERKAQEEEAKKHRRLQKEREAERRRKQEQHFKASRLAEKQAERKRKEAMLQARGYEDDTIAQFALGNKLSLLSTDSFAVSSSTDWEAQSKSIMRTRSHTSEDRWGLHVPSLGASVYCQTNNEKLSTSASFVGNGTSFPMKAVVKEAGFRFEASKDLKSQYSTPSSLAYAPAQQTQLESNIQSYEISPYKSSSDDDDEDDQPKKPVPLWARKENLLPQILWQQCMDPDDIFSTERTCSLAEIFGTSGSRRCKNFTERSTSGDWLDDHTTWKEELDYKKAMGYI